MKIAYLFCFLGFLLLCGCANPNTMLVNPTNGEMRNCAASGWGWAGAPMAVMSHNSCVDSLKSVGFVPVENVVPSVLTIKSDPVGADVYAGQTQETLKPIGKTPFVKKHPMKSRMWNKECYQAKKAGYLDSKVECFDPVWGDRNVDLKLVKRTGSNMLLK